MLPNGREEKTIRKLESLTLQKVRLSSNNPRMTQATSVEIVSFSMTTPQPSKADRQLLQTFVTFHWDHYLNDLRYVPLLDYEYFGSRVLGIRGYFEQKNSFFKHGDVRLFLARSNGQILGRCSAYVNHNHNTHWKDQVGFFGHFECVNDSQVARELLRSAESWIVSKGLTSMRGPQNFPVNEFTPGVMVEGFESRPVIYYPYNPPYYKDLLTSAGYESVMDVLSWEVSVTNNSIQSHLEKLSKKIVERNEVTFEHWDQRSLKVRKLEMFDIYNDAWSDNFGFVPFTREEFDRIIDDMQLVMNKKLFLFLYVRGQPAAFFGGVPNVAELMSASTGAKRLEFLRAIKLILFKFRIKGFRLGYLGVKKCFRRLGLDGVMLWKQSQISKQCGYEYCDIGYVLKSNALTVRLVERCGGQPSKRYSIFEKILWKKALHG